MKKVSLIIGMVAMVIIFVAAIVIFNNKEQIQASTTALEATGWTVHFSSELKSNGVQSEDIFIENQKGQKVTATIEIRNDKKSIVVTGIEPGNYKLHVKKDAFNKSSILSENQTVSFKIVKSLEAIKSKDELEEYFEAVMNKNNISKNNWGTLEESSTTDSAKDTANGDGGSTHSTTNNQVEGIEEGDITVVNERYLFVAKEQAVIITEAADAKNLKQVAKLIPVKEGYVQKLMLHNNLLLVVVDEYIQQDNKKNLQYGTSMTKLFIYNIEDPANAELVRVVGQEGYFTNIRKVGDTVYMILNHSPNYWIMEDDKAELRPATYDSAEGESYEPMDYKDISILPGTLEAQYSIIKAIDLSSTSEKAVETKGYLGSSSGLFMSDSALYLTGYKYEEVSNVDTSSSVATDMVMLPQSSDTDVYKWDINGTNINFVGSASVKGTALNQYSMDEYNGYFRIATTEGNTWNENAVVKNHLFILNDAMQIVGQVNDLAPGERIYSARFMGDKAYLVTFKEVDPLFVIDVADPTNPKVLGKLKIPGFSNYLHPLDDTHLIGIGYDTETKIDEYTKQPIIISTSMKLSLFDVSDINNPKEQQHVLIGGRGSYSEVQNDAKAFFRHEEKGLYGFPIVLYDETNNQEYAYQGSGALIYGITVENGIQLKGNLVEPVNPQIQYEDWESTVQRIVYIGDTLYTVAHGEVRSYDLNSFKQLGELKIN